MKTDSQITPKVSILKNIGDLYRARAKTQLKKRDLMRIDRRFEGVDPFGSFESFSSKQSGRGWKTFGN